MISLRSLHTSRLVFFLESYVITNDQVEIRELRGIAELAAAEALQVAVWGEDEVYEGKDLLLAVQSEGGLVAGAFATDASLVGFIFGFPTRQPQVQHSHRLAVLEGWRRLGLGARLKWFQRAWCLEHGIELVRWTFDPLRAVNADLNIRRLGATSHTYWENYYGEMAGINAGTPSDRLLVEWRLDDPRVVRNSQRIPADSGFPEAIPANASRGGRPADETLGLEARQVRVSLPEDFSDLLAHDLPLALEWRLHVRRLLEGYFQRGYAITQFTRVGGPAYALERIKEKG
jgi:chorismate synthase